MYLPCYIYLWWFQGNTKHSSPYTQGVWLGKQAKPRKLNRILEEVLRGNFGFSGLVETKGSKCGMWAWPPPCLCLLSPRPSSPWLVPLPCLKAPASTVSSLSLELFSGSPLSWRHVWGPSLAVAPEISQPSHLPPQLSLPGSLFHSPHLSMQSFLCLEVFSSFGVRLVLQNSLVQCNSFW